MILIVSLDKRIVLLDKRIVLLDKESCSKWFGGGLDGVGGGGFDGVGGGGFDIFAYWFTKFVRVEEKFVGTFIHLATHSNHLPTRYLKFRKHAQIGTAERGTFCLPLTLAFLHLGSHMTPKIMVSAMRAVLGDGKTVFLRTDNGCCNGRCACYGR